MKRIKFTRREQYESEGRNLGPVFEEGSVHEFDDAFADRWIRRNAAVEVDKRTPLSDGAAADGASIVAEKKLADHTIADLTKIAADEKIDLGDAKLKKDVVSAIELGREAKAKAAEGAPADGLEALDDEALKVKVDEAGITPDTLAERFPTGVGRDQMLIALREKAADQPGLL